VLLSGKGSNEDPFLEIWAHQNSEGSSCVHDPFSYLELLPFVACLFFFPSQKKNLGA
jgi:hypothetical protein